MEKLDAVVTAAVDLRATEMPELTWSGTLTFHPADPYAVTLTARADEPTTAWIFGRDLLLDGLHRPVGEGDVRVRPAPDADEPTTLIELRGEASAVVLCVGTRALRGFLAATLRVVPRGEETRFCRLGAVLEQLLAH